MIYENPKLPEGINLSRTNHFLEFILLAITTIIAIVSIVAVLALSAEYLVQIIPFTREQSLANKFSEKFFDDLELNDESKKRQAYLETLLERLKATQEISVDTVISVHYIDDDTLNAFATVGGHIFMHRGLFEKLSSENGLSMILAHELAHVKNRDPITAMARTLTVGIALGTLAGTVDNGVMSRLFNYTGTAATLSFSREQESKADDLALHSVYQLYGHLRGAEEVFEVLSAHGGAEPPAFLSTHPLTADRLEKIKTLSKQKLGAQLTPLLGAAPEAIEGADLKPHLQPSSATERTPRRDAPAKPTPPLPRYTN